MRMGMRKGMGNILRKRSDLQEANLWEDHFQFVQQQHWRLVVIHTNHILKRQTESTHRQD